MTKQPIGATPAWTEAQICAALCRQTFASLIRRAIELLKVVDDAADAFDPGRAAMPTLAFGVGYGEQGDSRVERGQGMLCAYQEDITLGLMMHPEVVDAMLFAELESLVRELRGSFHISTLSKFTLARLAGCL